jgi:hypothetical protein
MNGRPLTEAQISRALRAHLPKQAQAGLHERILVAVDTTAQQRALPSWLGLLQDANPDARRRNLLVAAALLIALAIAAAAAVGTWLPKRDVVPDLSLLPPAEIQPLPNPSLTAPSARPTASAVTTPGGIWIPTGTMGTPRDGHAAVRLLDGRVLVVGSEDENDTTAELYDPDNGIWSPTGNMLRPHQGFPATLLSDGRVLVGDIDDPAADDQVSGAELYDPASGTWTATGKMVWGGGATATLLRDGTVLVTGIDGAELYDPDSGTWIATGKMINPRYGHVTILLPDGNVLVAGGYAPGDQATDSAELYDPDTGTWTAIADMQAPRAGEAIEAFPQPDGKVLVVGSSRGDPQSAELYDSATGTWSATTDMIRPGAGYRSLTPLSDGRVLVRLIEPDGTRPTAIELYDPGTRSWTTAAPMLQSHESPATLLLDGTVLVAGGRDCRDGVCIATRSSELYVPAGVSPPPMPAFPSPPPPVIPTPTPRPTPYPPAGGPVPAGARPWKVTVVNKSSAPATLFVAEEGASGVEQLCGSVTPNVVPPGATMKVTFMLPPKRVKTCWIWVNAVPGEGGSFFPTSDAPLAGGFRIDAAGQVMWGPGP